MVCVCVMTMSADMFVIFIAVLPPLIVRCHHATLEQLTISLPRVSLRMPLNNWNWYRAVGTGTDHKAWCGDNPQVSFLLCVCNNLLNLFAKAAQ